MVILDELDRCKPTFAVDAIEKIKHLFSVQNVVFVLVMNKVQLEQSVKIVYGQELDAHTYLQKFINLETRIPKRLSDPYMSDASKYIQKLISLHEFETKGDNPAIIKTIKLLAIHLHLTLRQLEKVLTNLAVFYGSVPENHLQKFSGYEPLTVFMAVVKVVDPLLFEKCLTGQTSYEEVSKRFRFTSLESNDEYSQEIDFLIKAVNYAFLSEQEFNALPQNHVLRVFGEPFRHLRTLCQWLGCFVIE